MYIYSDIATIFAVVGLIIAVRTKKAEGVVYGSIKDLPLYFELSKGVTL